MVAIRPAGRNPLREGRAERLRLRSRDDDRPAPGLARRAGRDPDEARARPDGGRQRAGLSAAGTPLRCRPRLLRDGELRRDRAPQRANPRISPCRRRRASSRDPAVRVGPRLDGRGCANGRSGRRRPRGPELRLPRAEGDEDGCRRDAARRSGSGCADRLRHRPGRRHPRLREAPSRPAQRVARLPAGRAATGRRGSVVPDAPSTLRAADVHGCSRPRADGGARVARRRPRRRVGRHRLSRARPGRARAHRRSRGDGRPRGPGKPVGARGDRRRRPRASRRGRRSSPSSCSSSARPSASSASAGPAVS